MFVNVIANCHCLPLAETLMLGARRDQGLRADFIDVVFAEHEHMATKIERLFADESDDPVFSFHLSANLGRLETTALRARLGDRLHIFSNLYFSGLHPDITYLGRMGDRNVGYFGDYHSKLALFAFVTGRSEEDCLALFNGKTYELIGYFDAYEASANELLARDNVCDIKFGQQFLDMVRRGPCLYTINHPSGEVFVELANTLAARAGIPYVKFPPSFVQNHLSTNYIWPIYNEIAERHGLAYRVPQSFIHAQAGSARSDDLESFVRGSYAGYATADRNALHAELTKWPFFSGYMETLG